ncbi:MAG TPA: ATP-binding protein [Solirubrobacterales bacterium]|nr:ATP-binding protein [Solirubrobacterales bacterium]
MHRKWAGERLLFWRLGFFPTYDSKEIEDGLLRTLQQHNVLSYTCYELIGAYDLLLRAWVPNSESDDEVQESLIKNLSTTNLRLCERFVVSRTPRHWVWGDGREPCKPDEKLLRQPLPDEELIRIQDEPEANQKLVKKREEEHLIGDAEHSPGIKFFLIVTALAPAHSLFVERRLEKRLIDTLDDAPKGVSERSLYSGDGFGRFLMMGRIPFDQYSLLGEYFVKKMNDQTLREDFIARTYTHLAAFDQPLVRDDRLLPVDHERKTPAEPSVEELLSQEESEEIEVKGSFFLDLKRLIVGDHSANWDNEEMPKEVLTTITALLNTRGGTLVLGALEADRFEYGDIVDQLGRAPRVGHYIFVGIGVDYTSDTWDAFQRRIEQIIESRISPDPSPYLTISKQVVQDRDMCVITIKQPPADFFYHQGNEFYVRKGSRTMPLEGIDADQYRKAFPRP